MVRKILKNLSHPNVQEEWDEVCKELFRILDHFQRDQKYLHLHLIKKEPRFKELYRTLVKRNLLDLEKINRISTFGKV